jgi:hypothetical protein
MKVQDHPHLEKHNGVVINTDRQAYSKYLEDKKMRIKVDKLESDINTIKDMLEQLLNKES